MTLAVVSIHSHNPRLVVACSEHFVYQGIVCKWLSELLSTDRTRRDLFCEEAGKILPPEYTVRRIRTIPDAR
jgi:hypothetical protein